MAQDFLDVKRLCPIFTYIINHLGVDLNLNRVHLSRAQIIILGLEFFSESFKIV